MKKLMYVAPVFIDKERPDGVAKKVMNHFRVFKKYYDVSLIYYGNTGVVLLNSQQEETIFPYKNRHRRFALYDEVKRLYCENKYDFTYIRYPKSEWNFIRTLKLMKQSGSRIVIEIPTYPYNGNLSLNLKMLSIALGDAIFRTQLKKYVERIITYSDDSKIFGINTINTINGIDFESVPLAVDEEKQDVVSLISVATNYSCHGFDRVIEGMNNYYKHGGECDICFHIVGDGPAIETYHKLIQQYGLENRVILHGFLFGEKLSALYARAGMAVNSLALHRIGLKKESTLKTKEYAAKGLPILSSTPVDAFDEEGNKKYVYLVEDDESPIKMEKVIDFYTRIFDGDNKKDVAEDIRKNAQKICDMEVTLKKVIDFFESFNQE